MSIIGIVAVDRNLAIGKGGKLPWHYSADMKFFKQTTVGNAVVMGRRTWSTLKGPLPDRENIVLTRNGDVAVPDGVKIMNDLQTALAFSKTIDTHLFVIGGARVYEAFLPHIERWLVGRNTALVLHPSRGRCAPGGQPPWPRRFADRR